MTESEIDQCAIILWNYLRLGQLPQPSDIIFVPCSYDIRVAHHAAKLYKEGFGKYVVFSGDGAGRITELLFTKTEAETFADAAREHGVPDHALIVETKAKNTGENIRFSQKLLHDHGLHPASVLIVQKPYMERRVYASFKKQWTDPGTVLTLTSPPLDYYEYFDEVSTKQYVIESMVGDLQRLERYATLGFSVLQKIPVEVREAWRKLVEAGFIRRLDLPKTQKR